MRRSCRGRCALAGILVAAALLALAAQAPAVVVHLGAGKTLSYQPLRGHHRLAQFDEQFSNLDYNGGPVMASNSNYALYWRPANGRAYPAEYQEGVNQFFADLGHDSGGHENVESVSAQYNDAAGHFASYSSHFAGALVDEDPYPANGCKRASICLTDQQLQAELTKYTAEHGLPRDLAHEYFLLTPPGVEDCFEAAGQECSAGAGEGSAVYCAYHSNIPLAGGGELIYANDPFVSGNPGCDDGNHPNAKPSDGVIEGGLSHEHNESITDPEPNNAWTDIGGEGGEIGDKCDSFDPAFEFGPALGLAPNKATYNQVINGHLYWYQQEWSNQSIGCRQRLTFSGAEPTATFTSEPGAGNEMRFNATGSSATPKVSRYNWQFNDGPGHSLETPVETTGPTVSHTFPKAGTYVVALTVLAPDGTSIGTERTILTGDEGPTAAFSVGTAGPTASFNAAAASDPDGSISEYRWTFGDGAPAGSGVTPSHGYASAGTYSATLTVRDSSGQTASVTHPVSIGVSGPEPEPGPPVEPGPPPQSIPPATPPGPGPQTSPSPGSSGGTGTQASVTVLAAGPFTAAPNSSFAISASTYNARTGTLTFTQSVVDPGTLSWLLTFQNGRFGVFAAGAAKCEKGLVSLKGRCRPSKIVFGKGSMAIGTPSPVRFTVKPSGAALKALKNALRRHVGIPVTALVTFQSSHGGSPVSHTRLMFVKLKKKK